MEDRFTLSLTLHVIVTRSTPLQILASQGERLESDNPFPVGRISPRWRFNSNNSAKGYRRSIVSQPANFVAPVSGIPPDIAG
jgi:hypothetical protein